MTRSTLTGGLAALASLVGGPLAAQDAPDALRDAVAKISAGEAVTTQYADIDQDGAMEALVVFPGNCLEIGCLFGIVDETAEGDLAPVAYQYGMEPLLTANGTVISANGVHWTWDGQGLLPWADTYEDLEFYTGSPEEKQAILEVEPWHKGLHNYDIRIANIDMIGDEAPERFMYLDGMRYAVGQAQPYFIFDSEGDLMAKGAMIDRPYLFRLEDRKAAALIVNNGGRFETHVIR